MKKLLFVVSAICFCVILFLGILFLSTQKRAVRNTGLDFFPTPTPVSFSTQGKPQALRIISISPPSGTQDVPTHQTFTITFNKPVASKDLDISITPNISFATSFNTDTVTVTPTDALSENSQYLLFVRVRDEQVYTFTYLTPLNPSVNPPDNMQEIERDTAKNNNPDQYLRLFMPYSTDTFAVYSDYSYDSPPHYYFLVTLIGQDENKSKSDFLSWVSSLGLTKNQIKSLDVRYQKSATSE